MLVERAANSTDLDFIYSCLLYGARKGHYSFDVDNPAIVKAMKQEVQSVVYNGLLADQRYAIASIFMMHDKRAGLLILCEAAPGESNYEIYALSITKCFQRQGYAGFILDNVLGRLATVDVYARCSPASHVMQNLLMKRGFRPVSADSDFCTLMREAFDNNFLAGLTTTDE